MPEKKKTPRKLPTTVRNSRSLEPFMEEIAQTVLRPKIEHILVTKSDQYNSVEDLRKLFNEEYGTKISTTTFTQWMKQAGFQAQRAFLVTGPGQALQSVGSAEHSEPPTGPEPAQRPAPAPRGPRVEPQHGGIGGIR